MLRRGYLLLIGGGAAIILGLVMLGYGSLGLVQALEDAKYTVEPSKSVNIRQNLTSGVQGAYIASYEGSGPVRPVITVTDPTGKVVIQKEIDQPLEMQVFSVAQDGEYVLTLSNPSPDVPVEAGIILGRQESILGRAELLPQLALASTSLVVAGVVAIVTGIALVVLDRRRINKMKQFGDTSDLV